VSKGGSGFELFEKMHVAMRRGNRLIDEMHGRMTRLRPSFIGWSGARWADGRWPAVSALSMVPVLED
jgi:hypothetical protein